LPFLALKSFKKGSFWVRQLYLIVLILIICIFLFTLLVIFRFI
jgi:hypothetical protein